MSKSRKLRLVSLALLLGSASRLHPQEAAAQGRVDLKLHLSPSELHCRLVDQAPLKLTYRGGPFPSWRRELRKKAAELLGWPPQEKCGLNVRRLRQLEARRYTGTQLVFTSEPYVDVPCWLWIPKKPTQPIPVCICLQGASTGTPIPPGAAGVRPNPDYALQALNQGFAALCMEQRCYGGRKDDAVRATMHSFLLGRTMIGEKVYDVQRAIDMLEEQYPQLDAAKIAIAGVRDGGLTSFCAAAMDQRISAAMPAGCFCTFAGGPMRIRHEIESYIPGVLQWMEMYDAAGLIAPRPLVIAAWETDPICPIAAVRQAYEKAKLTYAAAGAPNNIRLIAAEDEESSCEEESWKALKELMGLEGLRSEQAMDTEAMARRNGGPSMENLALSSLEFHYRLADQAPLQLTYRGQPSVESWQKDVSAKLNELLGWAPDEKCELNVRQLEKTEARDYTRTKLVFTSEPYADVPCYLLIPKKARKPIPVCICLQGHTPGMHISLDAAGRAGDGDYAIQAVEEGFAALCIEQRCYGERREAKQEVRWQHGCFDAVMHSLALGRTMIGEKVYDVRRAIDMLEKEHAELDTAKIAITGCSGGGLGAFWAAAVDKRISASMPAGHFCTFADGAVRTVHCVEIYVPGILRWMEMHDVAGLIAPRPLVIITGDQDPIYPLAGVKQAYDKAAAIYAAAGAPGNVRLIVGEGGHRFYGRKEGSWKVLKELMGLLGSG